MSIQKKIGIVLLSVVTVCNSVVGAAASQETTSNDGDIKQFISIVNETLTTRLESLKLTIPGQNSDKKLLQAACAAADADYQKLKMYFSSATDDSSETGKVSATTVETVKKMYLDGLKLQAEANIESSEAFFKDWERGYCLRACALMEIEQILGEQFSEGESFSETEIPVMDQMRAYTGENEPQGTTAWFIQGFLADQGWMELSEIDGNAGDKTRGVLREYLIEHHAKVPCVIINRQLITRLIAENLLTEPQFTRVMDISTPDGQTIREKCEDPEFSYLTLANESPVFINY